MVGGVLLKHKKVLSKRYDPYVCDGFIYWERNHTRALKQDIQTGMEVVCYRYCFPNRVVNV